MGFYAEKVRSSTLRRGFVKFNPRIFRKKLKLKKNKDKTKALKQYLADYEQSVNMGLFGPPKHYIKLRRNRVTG